MSPTIAVLGTWTVLILWIVLLGAVPGVLAYRRAGLPSSIRAALWSGLAILVLALLIVNLFTALVGTPAVVVMAALTISSLIVAVGLYLRSRESARPAGSTSFPWWTLVPIAALALLLVVLAHAAFGTVGHYDSGLYHLNAIRFAADYPTIPGLGNVHDRYGTNVSVFNLAAFMGNLPWGADAFRLMVGFVVAVFVVDLALRLVDRPGWRSPGVYVMALAAMLFAPFLVAYTGYSITSPAADTTAMLASIASGAYLVDALWRKDSVSGALAVVTAALAASMRAQMWLMVVVTVVVLVAHTWRQRRHAGAPRQRPTALTWFASGMALVFLFVQLVRDTLLSGWLLYPAGNFPMPVEWRTGDPEVARRWIQSWAKAPGADPATTEGTWSWLGDWLLRVSYDWAVRGVVGLLVLALIVALTIPKPLPDDEAPRGPRMALLAVTPAALTTLVWFFTAPDPRFAWGAIALVGLIPASVALAAIRREDITVPVAAGFMAVFVLPAALGGFTSFGISLAPDWELRTYTFGPIEVTAAVNPVPVPVVEDVLLVSGDIAQRPVEGDQCWTVFPLCRPTAETSLRLRGSSIADGFVSGP